MTSIELKKALIHRISEINDITFLKAIKTILDSKTESKIMILTQEQRDEIMDSKKEIEEVKFFDNDVLNKEVSEWLKGK